MNVYGGSGTELRSHMHYIVTTIIPGESNYYDAHLIGEERGLEILKVTEFFRRSKSCFSVSKQQVLSAVLPHLCKVSKQMLL